MRQLPNMPQFAIRRLAKLGLTAAMAAMICAPGLALAQASPFLTGASSLQTNILAWLTPVAIIDGLKDALARLRKFNGRCVLGFQSIAQVSSTYGQGDAHTIIENCSNTLILRCSSSEGGGTARFASQLIGDREIVRTSMSSSRRLTELLGSVSRTQHIAIEPAVLASQVEQLPDLDGYLKYASDPNWVRVRLDAKQAWREVRANAPGARLPEKARSQRSLGAEHE